MAIQIGEVVPIETEFGRAEIISFLGIPDGKEHIAMAFGKWRAVGHLKVRIHSECLTGDVFGSRRCDCGPQLREAMRIFSKTSGVIVYLRQEGRGIGLINKLKAYRLQDSGLDTYEANRELGFGEDERSFDVAADMLRAMNITRVSLLSNNPRKSESLEENGIQVIQRVFTETYICEHNENYLRAKIEYGGHDGLKILKKEVAK